MEQRLREDPRRSSARSARSTTSSPCAHRPSSSSPSSSSLPYFHEIRSERADEHRFAHTLAAVFPEISGHLAGPHRESNERDLLQVELFQQLVEIGGQRVVVVARRRFARPAEAAAIVG